jgi:hypothetical protein
LTPFTVTVTSPIGGGLHSSGVNSQIDLSVAAPMLIGAVE